MHKTYNYTAFFQAEPEGGYTVTVPGLSGVVSFGKTIEEAEKNIREALILHIENLTAHGHLPGETEQPVYTRMLNIEFAS